MNDTKIDRTHGTSRRRVLGGLMGVAVAGVGGGIAEAAKGGNGKGQKKGNTKVTLCHNPGTPQQQTLVVGAPASKAHFAHGDIAGACPPLP